MISGTGALNHIGTDFVLLAGANSYSGTTTINTAGTLQVGGGGASGTLGTGNVVNNGRLVFNRSDTITVDNAISGTGQLGKVGTGTLTLTGDNTYSGGTGISDGTLQVGNGGTTGSLGSGDVLNNATLAFNRSDALTVANSIFGTGGLNQIGTGTTILTGSNAYAGTTTISAGVLQVGLGGTTGTLGTGAVTNNATLTFNRSNALTVANAISGTGGLNQIGTGTTIFTGANSYTGATTITAGTLQIGNGGTTGTLGTGNVVNDATLAVNIAGGIDFGNAISGTGGLNLIGTGSVALTGANTYTGTTTINAGALQVGDGGTSGTLGTGNVVNNGSLVFNRSDALTVANAISGNGLLLKLGAGTTILTGANSYDFTQIIAGTLQVGNGGTTGTLGTGDVSNGGTLAFNRSDALTVANSIFGTGGLNQIGTGTTILTGANTYSGATSVNAGRLTVNGSIASSSGVTVNTGGTLGGTGQLPGTLVTTGGTIAPGNSVGTLTVNGNLTLNAGSFTTIEVQAATIDRINVTGTAALNGALQLVALGGPYQFGTPYTFLQAATRTGTFATVSTTGTFGDGVTSQVSYSPTQAQLTLTAAPLVPVITPPAPGQTPLTPIATTANPLGVAVALDLSVITGGGNASPFFGLYNQPVAGILTGLSQLSGEANSGIGQQGFSVASDFVNTILGAFTPGSGTTTQTPQGAAYAATKTSGNAGSRAIEVAADLAPAPTPVIEASTTTLWGSGTGGVSTLRGNAVQGSSTRSETAWSLAAGIDKNVARGINIGAAVSGGRFEGTTANNLGSNSADVFQAGLYGRARFGALSFGAALAYTYFDISSTRNAAVIGLLGINGKTDAHGFSGRFEGAYEAFNLSGLGISPFAAVQGSIFSIGGYTETVGAGQNNAAALRVASSSPGTVRGELGLRLEQQGVINGVQVLAFARSAWGIYGARDASATAAFIGLPGSTFTITGAQNDTSTALVAAGLDVKLTPSVTLGGRFDGEYGNRTARSSGTAKLKIAF